MTSALSKNSTAWGINIIQDIQTQVWRPGEMEQKVFQKSNDVPTSVRSV